MLNSRFLNVFICTLFFSFVMAPAMVAAGAERTVLVSVGNNGDPGNDHSYQPEVTDDGRYVFFVSEATNLVDDDTNGVKDLFRRDMETGDTQRVLFGLDDEEINGQVNEIAISPDGRYVAFTSVAANLTESAAGEQTEVYQLDLDTGQIRRASLSTTGVHPNMDCSNPSISENGQYLVFQSKADNLLGYNNDLNGIESDIFVRDISGETLELVSASTSRPQGQGNSYYPSISDDGKYIAFESWQQVLVSNDTNQVPDIFVRDRETGVTTRVSVSSTGEQANAQCQRPEISGNGRYIVFESTADNLVDGDTNGSRDIFVHDRETGETERVSVSSSGEQADGICEASAISADGRYVIFFSMASNLVPNDTGWSREDFVHDCLTGKTTRASIAADGGDPNGNSGVGFSVSSTGPYAVFVSGATNLVEEEYQYHGAQLIYMRGPLGFRQRTVSLAPIFNILLGR